MSVAQEAKMVGMSVVLRVIVRPYRAVRLFCPARTHRSCCRIRRAVRVNLDLEPGDDVEHLGDHRKGGAEDRQHQLPEDHLVGLEPRLQPFDPAELALQVGFDLFNGTASTVSPNGCQRQNHRCLDKTIVVCRMRSSKRCWAHAGDPVERLVKRGQWT